MQTFDVSANILHDRLIFSTARAKPKFSCAHAREAASGATHADNEQLHESQAAVRGLAVGLSLTQLPCARTTFHTLLAIALMQLVACVLLFLLHTQRFSARFLCGAGLLATPLAAIQLTGASSSVALLCLLALHDTLVVLALAA